MPTISLNQIHEHRPDILLPPDPEFAASYRSRVEKGEAVAKRSRVAFVAICRNAMPWLPLTLELVEQAGARCGGWSCYIYENDSTDGTKECLSSWADGTKRVASITDNGRPHLNYTTATVRTHALAEYRSECQRFVAENGHFDFVVVFDTDPWGGFSIDGIMNTLGWMEDSHQTVGMASYSWCEWGPPVWPQPTICHYDAFAARLNHWHQRDQLWFHLWHPAVGSPPVKFNSAFGQLAVYRARSFLAGRYTGEDCEHVTFHKSLGGDFYLNPSMRVTSFWIPKDESKTPEGDRLHGDLHDDVAGRDADPHHRRNPEDLR
jgi:hypothetical protein